MLIQINKNDINDYNKNYIDNDNNDNYVDNDNNDYYVDSNKDHNNDNDSQNKWDYINKEKQSKKP